MAYPNSTCYDPQRPSWLPFWIDSLEESKCYWGTLNPSFGDAAAAIYERQQYGEIPRIYNQQPTAAAPPDNRITDPNWNPAEAGAAGHAAYTAALRQRIASAEASGAYNPAGNLPMSATTLDQWKWPLIIGAGAIGLILLLKVK